MLNQGSAPDPKCKLNIALFLTLPHLLYCLVCAKDIMIIVLLLQVMGDGKVGGGSFMLGFGWGKGAGYQIFSTFCSVLVLLLIVLSWLVHDSLLCLCHRSFFAFVVSGPFN